MSLRTTDRAGHLVMEDNHMDKLYSSTNPAIRWFFNRRLDVMAGLLPTSPSSILDAGCGEGHLLRKLTVLRGHDAYFGIDILDAPLRQARRRCPQADLRQGDICRLPYADQSFEAVICSDVLEHIHDYPLAIAEIKRVIKRGGSLILVTPNETLWTLARLILCRRPIRVPDHVNAFSDKQLIHAVGWKVGTQKNMPFGLPFGLSLCTAIRFLKPVTDEGGTHYAD